MSHGGRQNQRGAGFSIIELVMVTAILAVVASIAAPRYATSLHRYRTDAAARQVAAELMQAHALARQTSDTVRVQFDLPHHRLLMPDTPGEHETTPTIRLDRKPYRVQLMQADFGDTAEARFDGHGRPASGGTIVLGSGSVTRTITLHPVSGQARISE